MRFFALLLTLVVLTPQAAFAARAEIMLIPTRVVMEKSDRYTTVIIKNIGDASGNLNIDLIDMTMAESGGITEMPAGVSDPYSAIPLLRVSPHSVTLKPGDSQNVRIMLRKPENLEAGEYRSHLKVKIDDDNVEATEARKMDGENETAISVKAKIALTIPVIVRSGDTAVTMKMESVKVVRDDKGKPSLDLVLVRGGNRSVMGDFAIMKGSDLIKAFPGIPVYRSTERRQVSIPLDDLPPGTDLAKGKLTVSYTAQEKEGGMKLAEATVDPAAR